MFEKEAEEYALVRLPDGYTKIDHQKRVDFQKGAEFGYNKGKNEAKELLEEVCNSIPSSVAEYIKEPLKKAEAFLKE